MGELGDRAGWRFERHNAATDMIGVLDRAGFSIVPHPGHVVLRNCACCCDQPAVPPNCPACKGAGGFPAPHAPTVVTGNASLVYGGLVQPDGTVTLLGKGAMDAGVVAIGERPLKLEPGKSSDLPRGTEIQWHVGKPALYALTPKAEAAIKAFVDSVPPTQEAARAGSDALEREIERSFDEPLDAGPDGIADQRAQAVRRVIQANYLLAQAVEVLGPEAVDVLMHSLPVSDVAAA